MSTSSQLQLFPGLHNNLIDCINKVDTTFPSHANLSNLLCELHTSAATSGAGSTILVGIADCSTTEYLINKLSKDWSESRVRRTGTLNEAPYAQVELPSTFRASCFESELARRYYQALQVAGVGHRSSPHFGLDAEERTDSSLTRIATTVDYQKPSFVWVRRGEALIRPDRGAGTGLAALHAIREIAALSRITHVITISPSALLELLAIDCYATPWAVHFLRPYSQEEVLSEVKKGSPDERVGFHNALGLYDRMVPWADSELNLLRFRDEIDDVVAGDVIRFRFWLSRALNRAFIRKDTAVDWEDFAKTAPDLKFAERAQRERSNIELFTGASARTSKATTKKHKGNTQNFFGTTERLPACGYQAAS